MLFLLNSKLVIKVLLIGLIQFLQRKKECDKGHWIDITFDASMCSVCQTTQEYETKYCPECGAKMDGDNNVK